MVEDFKTFDETLQKLSETLGSFARLRWHAVRCADGGKVVKTVLGSHSGVCSGV